MCDNARSVRAFLCVISYDLTRYRARRFTLPPAAGGVQRWPDSTVLLHRLKLWRDREPDVQLRAMHIHHGLSPHAEDWVAHCEAVCSGWEIPLIVERVTLEDEGLGIEAQARKARYAAFSGALQPGEALVTAQHLDDQCETFYWRSSGAAGLRVYPPCLSALILLKQSSSARCWVRRAHHWKPAQQHHLCWIEDDSNQDDSYDRNFLRLRVLPLLSERWAHFSEAAARSAMLCAEQESLLDELLSGELNTLITADGALNVAPLKVMSPVRRVALIRRWLAYHRAVMPSVAMLNRIWEEVAQAREDAAPCIHLNGYDVRRYKGQLWWVKSVPSLADVVLDWPSPEKH